MNKVLVGILLIFGITGCATNDTYQEQIYYTAPPRVVYVAPYYPAPGFNWQWAYSYRHGWGWYHHRHGFHHHYRR